MFLTMLPLPMLSIITLWGGVDMELLAFHFVLMSLLILLVGSMCLWVSARSAGYTAAMVLAYVLEGIMGYYGAFFIAAEFEGKTGFAWPLALWVWPLVTSVSRRHSFTFAGSR